MMVATITALCFVFVSCIQSEAPNAEADIISCIVTPEEILLGNPQISNDRIVLRITSATDPRELTRLAIDFILTPGATIDPPSGTIRDFTEPQTYKVTSEDKKWTKTYTVSCMTENMLTLYSFENYRIIQKVDAKGNLIDAYHEFYEIAENGEEQNIWNSGNPGFKMIAGNKGPSEYPTSVSEDGLLGKCAKLVTCDTGVLGAMFKSPLAAGNLFIGSFITNIGNTLKSTHFGEKFNYTPIAIRGYYKYQSGEVYKQYNKETNKSTIVPDKKDELDIYGILFETDDKVKYLDGTHNFEHPNLVSIARIAEENRKETNEWTYFYIPFEMLPGKEIDPEKLEAGKYSVSIVFSSSINGAYFSGSIGSTLFVDEVELIYDNK
ncbi:hypothetical protein D0T85_13600 [Bacteroides sp. 519]|nr:hypothetical protein [Bacteroides sp. 519]